MISGKTQSAVEAAAASGLDGGRVLICVGDKAGAIRVWKIMLRLAEIQKINPREITKPTKIWRQK